MKRNSANNDHRFFQLGQSGPLPELPFVALAPGVAAPLLPLDLPKGLRGQARERVARLQISDGIGLPAEQLELRPFAAKPHVDPWQHVIITDTKQITKWRDRCEGAPCRAILPDYLSLPVIPDVWTIATTSDMTTARLGLEDGFSAEHPLALTLLAKAAKPKAVFRLGVKQPDLDALLQGLGVPICGDKTELAAQKLPAPQVLGHGELAFDLRQNPLAAFDTIHTTLRAWCLPVLLALLGLVFWSASTLISVQGLQTRAVEVRIATVADVRKYFVPNGPVLDIQAQVNQALNTRQAQNQETQGQVLPLALFKVAAQIMMDHPATLITASFNMASGVTTALNLPDFASLDGLVAALEQDGIAVQILESSSAEAGGVNSILVLQTKGQAQND